MGYTNSFIEPESKNILTAADFYKKGVVLKKYKIPELKDICKKYRLRISGSKPELIDRIEGLFLQCYKATIIQRVFRRHIVMRILRLRGDGFKDRSKCVNENDFYSLDPLKEIPHEYFFSFNSGKFTYGCDINSLIQLIKQKAGIKNPYNRENISIEIIRNICELFNLIKMKYGVPKELVNINTAGILKLHMNTAVSLPRIIVNNITLVAVEIILDRQIKLTTMRAKPFLNRVQEMFMEIDLLGNYTHYQWFMNLERRDYIRLYRTLHDIWTFRGHLSRDLKNMICVVDDPFFEVHRDRVYMPDAPMEVIREICLKIFENMVYCGADDEYRKIGTLHALTALTNVSVGARNALPWLFESLNV